MCTINFIIDFYRLTLYLQYKIYIINYTNMYNIICLMGIIDKHTHMITVVIGQVGDIKFSGHRGLNV